MFKINFKDAIKKEVRESIKDYEAGKYQTWEEVRKELGLEEANDG